MPSPHEGNTEEEQNGYVVFKCNISTDQLGKGGGEGGERYSAVPIPLYSTLLNRYVKTTRTVFLPFLILFQGFLPGRPLKLRALALTTLPRLGTKGWQKQKGAA
jgi:hypothetical protein